MSTFGHIDDEGVALIIQLLRQDSQEIVSTAIGKGKQLEGTETDTQVAFNLFIEELRQAESFAADVRMTRSIQNAIQVDGEEILQVQNEEQVATDDHNLSVSLSNGGSDALKPRSTPKPSTHDDELIDKMACIYITGVEDIESDDDTAMASHPESSAWAASRKAKKTLQRRLCDACGEQKHFAELSRTPCQHEYCRRCLSRLFQDAMVDESLFPPRCCRQPIPLDRSQLFLDADVVRQFRQKAIEFSTPNRTYCHNTDCAAFIPPNNCSGTTASCNQCHSRTCTTCKDAFHDGDCPNDEQLQRVLQLAREQGWQRYQNCWGMVELNTGCNHMTCRCGFQFCYICGAHWKTCNCEHWDEHRLYERAAQIDARYQAGGEQGAIQPGQNVGVQPPADRGPDQQGAREQTAQGEIALQQPRPVFIDEVRLRNLQQRIQTIAQDLRDNHECDHPHWFSRAGPQPCEECFDVMPLFIYECRQCHITACRRCRYHRL